MATGTYMGVTVHVADEVAASLPSEFVFDGVEHDIEQVNEADGVQRPAASASRGDWAKYAESVGIDPGEMTKAELQAAVGDE